MNDNGEHCAWFLWLIKLGRARNDSKRQTSARKSLFASGKAIFPPSPLQLFPPLPPLPSPPPPEEVRWILRLSGRWTREKLGFTRETLSIAASRRVIALQNCSRNFFIDRKLEAFHYCSSYAWFFFTPLRVPANFAASRNLGCRSILSPPWIIISL